MSDEIRVLFTWRVPDRLRAFLDDRLRGEPDLRLIFPRTAAAAELLELAPSAEVVIGWEPTPELLRAARRLRLFIVPAAGLEDVIDLFRRHRERRPFVLVNGHGNSYLAAQQAVAMLLALNNKLIPHHNWMAAGRWRTGDREGASMPLRRRRVGLLGYGAINRKVHRFLSGFDLDFTTLRRRAGEAPAGLEVSAPGDLHGFLRRTDILMVAVPSTPATHGLLGGEELRLLGPEALIVNVARAGICDEDALYDALASSTIAGAALDVWYDEQPEPRPDGRKYPFRRPFHRLPNVLLSPHRGASPLDDLPRWTEVVENLTRLAHGRSDLLNQVSLDAGY